MVYAVLDAQGNLEGLESTRDGALERAEETSARGVDGVFVDPAVWGSSLETRSNPVPTPEVAYEMTTLPAILRHKYGVDHLTGQMVHNVSLDDAYESLRPFFPPGKGEGSVQSAKYGPGPGWSTPARAVSSLFSVNAKLAKGLKKSKKAGDLGDLTVSMGLALAPHQVGFRNLRDVGPEPEAIWKAPPTERLLSIASGDREHLAAMMQRGGTFCARSTPGCRSSCLVFSGQNEVANEPYIFKMALTAALLHDPLAFARLLLEASRRHFYLWSVTGTRQSLVKGGKRVHVMARSRDEANGVPPGAFIRLNVYSDIPWELFFPELVFGDWAFMPPYLRGKLIGGDTEIVSDGMWYDYTAIYGRHYPGTNYDVTMSFKGSSSNVRDIRKAIDIGQRVAVVFVARSKKGGWAPSGGKELRDRYKDTDVYPWEFMGMPVWNADRTDIRPDDPEGYIAGLTYKVPRKKVAAGKTEAMADLDELIGKDKFVIEVVEVDGHLLAVGVPWQENSTEFVQED